MHPTKRQFAKSIVKNGKRLVSLCGETVTNLGFIVDANLDVKYYRIADEEELAQYRLFQDMNDDRHNGGNGKEEVITCSVCLEDLRSGMEVTGLVPLLEYNIKSSLSS